MASAGASVGDALSPWLNTDAPSGACLPQNTVPSFLRFVAALQHPQFSTRSGNARIGQSRSPFVGSWAVSKSVVSCLTQTLLFYPFLLSRVAANLPPLCGGMRPRPLS